MVWRRFATESEEVTVGTRKDEISPVRLDLHGVDVEAGRGAGYGCTALFQNPQRVKRQP